MGIVGKKVATKEKRWYKDVGLGFKTPAEAISGTYIGESICSSQFNFTSNHACMQTRNVHLLVTFPSEGVF